jgi:hypothetical protein
MCSKPSLLVKGHHLHPIHVHPSQRCVLKVIALSQGAALTSYSRPSQSALCAQSHRSSVKGHHLHPIHVHPSQHCVLKVIGLQSRVITYNLFTSTLVSAIYSKPSLLVEGHHLHTIHVHPSQRYMLKAIALSQGASLTHFSRPSQSALYAQSHRSSVKGHHLHPIHVHPSQRCVLKVIALQSRVITYTLFTSIPVSAICSKSSVFSQGSSLTPYSRPSQSALEYDLECSLDGNFIPVFQLIYCPMILAQILQPQVRQRQMPWQETAPSY